MGMTRQDAVAYLRSRYAPLEELTDTVPSDSPLGYQQVINDALLTLPVDYDSAVSGVYEQVTKTREYRALLRFYALTMFKTKLAPDESATIGDSITIKRSVAFTQVSELLDDVLEELIGLGYVLGATTTTPKRGFRLRDMYGDYIEPDTSAEA
jgi:hypothetical protein